MATNIIMAMKELMAMTSFMATNALMAMKDSKKIAVASSGRHGEVLRRVAEIFNEAGWRVESDPSPGHADLLLRRGQLRYAAELKIGLEPRRDRLIPLLAAGILESQAAARMSSAKPLALVSSPRLPEAVVRELVDYAFRVAPDVAIGVMDFEGRVEMRGPGLEKLNSRPMRSVPLKQSVASHEPFDLFSDLNQWLLKVLLAPRFPAELLNAPRAAAANGAELAEVSHVSAPSVSRLLRHLNAVGWLDDIAPLRLVRVQELIRQWKAVYVRPPRDIKMRWLIPGRPDQLLQALRRRQASGLDHDEPDRVQRPGQRRPRACLGLYSAANVLGFGHVRGVPEYVYLERPDAFVLDEMGLVSADIGDSVNVVVRIPRWPRSLFRAAVERDGVLVSDILQVWLDVSEHPARGSEQADEIWRRVLRDALEPGDAA